MTDRALITVLICMAIILGAMALGASLDAVFTNIEARLRCATSDVCVVASDD